VTKCLNVGRTVMKNWFFVGNDDAGDVNRAR
jgi:hypothetical protein